MCRYRLRRPYMCSRRTENFQSSFFSIFRNFLFNQASCFKVDLEFDASFISFSTAPRSSNLLLPLIKSNIQVCFLSWPVERKKVRFIFSKTIFTLYTNSCNSKSFIHLETLCRSYCNYCK